MEIVRNYPTQQVRSRVFPKPEDQIGKSAKMDKMSIPQVRGTLILTVLQSVVGHTILVAARFRFGMVIGATRRKLRSLPSNSRLAACQARNSAS